MWDDDPAGDIDLAPATTEDGSVLTFGRGYLSWPNTAGQTVFKNQTPVIRTQCRCCPVTERRHHTASTLRYVGGSSALCSDACKTAVAGLTERAMVVRPMDDADAIPARPPRTGGLRG
jgi:hypothetical protein